MCGVVVGGITFKVRSIDQKPTKMGLRGALPLPSAPRGQGGLLFFRSHERDHLLRVVSAHLSAQPTEIKLRGCAPLAEGPQVPARVDRAWVQEVELWREDFRSSLFFLLPAVTRQAPEGTRQGLSALTW